MVACAAAAFPWCVTLVIMEDWAKGRSLRESVKTTVTNLIEEIPGFWDDFTDMSYLDRGEAIEL
jgi:hypothetical protein